MREPEFILIIGAPGTGKTTIALKILHTIKRKTLIPSIDRNNVLFKNVQTITPDQLTALSKKNVAYQILFDPGYKNFWQTIEQNFRNGALFIDDATYFLTDARAHEFKKMILRNRHTNNDVIWIAHGLSEIPPNFFTYVSKLILFKTTDSFERKKTAIANYDFYKKAVEFVNLEAVTKKHVYKIFKIR